MRAFPLLALMLLAGCASPQPPRAAPAATAVEPGIVPLTLEQQRQIEEAQE